jgi:hypothetical protein
MTKTTNQRVTGWLAATLIVRPILWFHEQKNRRYRRRLHKSGINPDDLPSIQHLRADPASKTTRR